MKSVQIINHLQMEGAKTLRDVLDDRGFEVSVTNAPREGLDHIDPLAADLLVLMGGPIGVYQAEDYPFINAEIAIAKTRIDNDKATIGICLGSQIIAAAMGANVYPGAEGKEGGWNPLFLTDAGKNSPAHHLAGHSTNMFHWHGDTFDLPEGATLLASSSLYKNQIYSAGNNILGLQCHPEVQDAQLQEWFVMLHGDLTGAHPLVPIADLKQQTSDNIQTLNRQAKLFFNAWLDDVGL